MRDRVPAPGKENRVRITQDNGQVVEGVLAYADSATQEGSTYTPRAMCCRIPCVIPWGLIRRAVSRKMRFWPFARTAAQKRVPFKS